MKISTKQRKQSANQFQQIFGADEFSIKVAQTIDWGKRSIDILNQEVGKMLVFRFFVNQTFDAII